jgi:uncharacterized membrane protein YfcA
MDITKILILFIGGTCAGTINTIAGGGTLITFPLLIFLGVDTLVAVATNRLAILIQTLTASITFYRGGVSNPKMSIILSIPAMIASILGALLASTINKSAFRTSVALLILLVLAIIIIDPKKRLKSISKSSHNSMSETTRKGIGIAVFFLIGLYGGFFGAGVGIMMLTATFLIFDLDFLYGNGVKVVVNLFISIGAVSMFAYMGKVDYLLAVPLSIANALGAYIGAKLSLKRGHQWIRGVVLLVGLISIVKLIFF